MIWNFPDFSMVKVPRLSALGNRGVQVVKTHERRRGDHRRSERWWDLIGKINGCFIRDVFPDFGLGFHWDFSLGFKIYLGSIWDFIGIFHWDLRFYAEKLELAKISRKRIKLMSTSRSAWSGIYLGLNWDLMGIECDLVGIWWEIMRPDLWEYHGDVLGI